MSEERNVEYRSQASIQESQRRSFETEGTE